MPQPNSEAFEAARAAHQAHIELTTIQPVGRTALLSSLEVMTETGSVLLVNGDISPTQYADTMQKVLNNALVLEVEPPFTEGQKASISRELHMFGVITEASKVPEVPKAKKATETKKINTGKAKQ